MSPTRQISSSYQRSPAGSHAGNTPSPTSSSPDSSYHHSTSALTLESNPAALQTRQYDQPFPRHGLGLEVNGSPVGSASGIGLGLENVPSVGQSHVGSAGSVGLGLISYNSNSSLGHASGYSVELKDSNASLNNGNNNHASRAPPHATTYASSSSGASRASIDGSAYYGPAGLAEANMTSSWIPDAPHWHTVDLPPSRRISPTASPSQFPHGYMTPPGSPHSAVLVGRFARSRAGSHGVPPQSISRSSASSRQSGQFASVHPLLTFTPGLSARCPLFWNVLNPPLIANAIRINPAYASTYSSPLNALPFILHPNNTSPSALPSQYSIAVQIILNSPPSPRSPLVPNPPQVLAFPWSIHIRTPPPTGSAGTSAAGVISILDLLTQIHASFARPVTESDLTQFHPQQVEAARQACAHRFGISRHGSSSATNHGLIRADFLGGYNYLLGLMMMPDGSLVLQLSAAPSSHGTR